MTDICKGAYSPESDKHYPKGVIFMDGQNLAKQALDQIAGVGIAHRGETEYLKSIPDGSENNNLGSLPSVSPEGNA